MTLKTTLTLLSVALIVGACGGAVLAWKMTNPPSRLWPVSAAPSVRLRDGALVAERIINPDAKPKQALPAGSKPVRTLSGVVTPRTSGSSPEDKVAPAGVTVDVTLTDDGRAVMSSPDGTVTGGTDTWIVPPRKPAKHQVLAAYNWLTKDAVLGYTRRVGSIGPVTFRAGGMVVYQDKKPGAYALVTGEW